MKARRVAVLAVVVIGCLAATSSLVVDSAPFAVNPERFDPYTQCKFRVKWDGRYIPDICSVSGLVRRTEVIVHREGGEPSSQRRSPGLTNYDPIILKRGRTHDTAFEAWANKVWNFGSGMGAEVSLADYRKDIVIELYNEAGQLVMAWKVYRCWPSKYEAVSSLNADFCTTALETITLQHEGWERDYEVTEPTEQSYTEPGG
jgi:phage tail-like protein